MEKNNAENNQDTATAGIKEQMTTMQKRTGLKLINAAVLDKEDLPPVQFLVDKILSPGCCLFAGGHKGGKSYMALQLCLCVAGDTDFLGLPTEHGTCLYCALEDNKKRLQSRMRQLLEGKDVPQRLNFTLEIPRIGEGLEEVLESYLEAHPDTKLIVIDTLAFARGEKMKGESDYRHDYRDIHALKAIADKHETCILLIHHMRKMKAEDIFDEIAGGVGLPAAADTIMTLEKKIRTDWNAVLHITGRDVEADRFAIQSDSTSRCWTLLGNSDYIKKQDYENSPIVTALRKILDNNNHFWSGTMADLLTYGNHILGFDIAKSTSALSKEIAKLEPELATYDNISHTRCNPNGGAKGRIHEFRLIEDNIEPDETDNEQYFASMDDCIDDGTY